MYRDMIARSADRYRREYGEVPEFKGALHMGPIVATEVGEIRTELQLHGDALNTASRMLAECNELGADLLVSEEIGSLLEPVKGVSFETVGPLDLRGKGSSVGVLRAVFDGSAAGQPMPERAAKAKTGSHS